MIAYIKGKILIKGKSFLIIEINGLGYKVFVSEQVLDKAKKESIIKLFTFTYLKRETIEIYGCSSQNESALFEILEKISGIGPKTALSLAGFGSIEALKKAVEKQDNQFLKMAKGIGKKRRQRLLLELTGRIEDFNKKPEPQKDQAFITLLSLGFSSAEIKEALSTVSTEIKSAEERVKKALKVLGQKPK